MNSQFIGLLICAALAIGTIVAKEKLWYLGGVYWFVLGLCALAHICVTGIVIFTSPGATLIRSGALALLIVGQWWGIQMIAMQIIWRLRGFSP